MKCENLDSLEKSLKELMRHIRIIADLETGINARFGVKLITSMVPSTAFDAQGEVVVKRGMEEIEKALGKESKLEACSTFYRLLELRHYGIRFVQYADDKTKTFVKAWKEPPKIQIVEDE